MMEIASPQGEVEVLLLQVAQESPMVSDPLQVYAPVGMGYLAARLSDAGYRVAFRLIGYDQPPESAAREIMEDVQPTLLGISATGNEIPELARIADMAKDLQSELMVIAGGYCSIAAESLLRDSKVDIVAVGEGEDTITELASVLLSKQGSIEDVAGIVYRSNDGTLIRTPERPAIRDLDALPVPSYPHHPSHSPSIRVYASRGCPFRCSFCRIKDFFGTRQIRYHSRSYMKVLIQGLLDRHAGDVRVVFFNDDEFMLVRQHFLNMVGLIREFGLKMCFQTRTPDVLRHLDLLQENIDVIHQVHLGVESFSQAQLDRWEKDNTVKNNRQALKALGDIGCSYYPYMILSDEKTTSKEIQDTCMGLLDLPPCPQQVDGVTVEGSPLHFGLHLNRYKLFRGQAARSPHTAYLDDVWDFIRDTRSAAGKLTSLNRHAVSAGMRSAEDRSGVTDLLDERLRRIIKLAQEVEEESDPDVRQELSHSHIRAYSEKVDQASLDYMAPWLREVA